MSTFHEDYQLLEELGRGRFGVVSKCKSLSTHQIFAVKTINKSLVSDDYIDQQSLINEPKALNLLSLSSPALHVTRLHSTYDAPTHLHLVLDYFPYPSLYTLIVSLQNNNNPILEHDARAITFSLLHAVMHCHASGVIHRDIKPENILVDPGSKQVKLCDFGSAGFITNNGSLLREVVGTPYYVAPEILQGNGYNEKVDEWSAGVVLYLMVAGVPPFYGERVEEVFEKVLRGNLRFPKWVFGSCSVELKDLLRKLLCRDVSRRLSAQDALRHPWFKGIEDQQSMTLTKAENYS